MKENNHNTCAVYLLNDIDKHFHLIKIFLACLKINMKHSQNIDVEAHYGNQFWWWETTMTTRCGPACSQALPVKPQGVWARGIEAWAWSRDRRNLEFLLWGSSGPSSLMLSTPTCDVTMHKMVVPYSSNVCENSLVQWNVWIHWLPRENVITMPPVLVGRNFSSVDILLTFTLCQCNVMTLLNNLSGTGARSISSEWSSLMTNWGHTLMWGVECTII